MPFGISSAPEVWQQKINELVEGLKGVKVIADDFLICGFGSDKEEATANHVVNLRMLLQRARERGLKLNLEKVKLQLTSVPFIGHLLTDKGLAPDPNKVTAFMNMPTPTNVKSLQQLLGMVQHLSKFLPQLSTITEPLRQLGHRDTEWKWSTIHDSAVHKVKDLICKAPVLRYFDPAIELTLQFDASESGLGYALLQQGQPVVFGARGMTQTEETTHKLKRKCSQLSVAVKSLISLYTDTKPP